MAAIGQIRRHYALLVAIIGIALAAFVLGDLFKATPQQAINIGVVNGEEISYRDFSVEADKAIEAEKKNKQTAQLTSSEVFRIKQSTWTKMVKEIIMKSELEELGLTVTTDELFDLVQGDRPHRYITQYFTDPATGQFNGQLVLQYLQTLDQMPRESQLQWIEFERAIKEDQLNTKFNNLISKGYYVPKALAKLADTKREAQVEVQFVAQPYTAIPDNQVTVTDADYEKYYQDNKEDFKQDETRDIEYVVFEVKPSDEDREFHKAKFDDTYNELKKLSLIDVPVFVNSASDKNYVDKWYKQGELPLQVENLMFMAEPGTTVAPYISNNTLNSAILLERAARPDSLKASHILIAYAGANSAGEDVKRIKPAAQRLADSLLTVVKKNPASIEYLAIALSNDGAVKQNKGHYDWFPDGQMVPEFNEAVANGKEGDVVMVETVFGFHVIRIDGKKNVSDKVKVALLERKIEAGNQTFQDFYVKANEFASKCKSSNFDKVVQEMGLNKRSLTDLTAMQENIPGQVEGRQVITWAFNADRKISELNLFDMGGSYIVSILTKIKPEGYATLADVKQNITPAVTNLKKGDVIIDKMKSSGNLNNLSALASEFNTTVSNANLTFDATSIPGFGPEAEAIGAAVAMESGATAGTIKGSKAVFVFKALDKRPATVKSSYEDMVKQMTNRFISSVNFRMYKAIEDEVEIVDNRHIFY
jgi:peptidyl-prolyl cis-trans isomerase D